MATDTSHERVEEHGVIIRALASFCHRCRVCPYAAMKPNTPFERVMRWHRTWCPAWSAHTRVYGLKPLACASTTARR